MLREGHGFVIQASYDTPWAGWFSVQKLDWMQLVKTSLPLFLRQLGEMSVVLPGGISLLWDTEETLPQAKNALKFDVEHILANYPGIALHSKKTHFSNPVESPLNVWYHLAEMPEGDFASSWCKGLAGWVPQVNDGWSLPGVGSVTVEHDDCSWCMLWGEIVIPATAVAHIDIKSIQLAIEDIQANIERGMSLRTHAGGWPKSVPFWRRQTVWRLAITGGWEYQLSGQQWDRLAADMSNLKSGLSSTLKCNIQLGINHDAIIAGILAEQALKYGYPWRSSLSPPPSPPSFSPGIGADPRKASPIEARAFFPKSISELLSDPPIALLRVPAMPSIEGCRAFLNRLDALPAIKWIPPDIPLSGPFHANIPWDPASDFPHAEDGKARQPRLFDWEE